MINQLPFMQIQKEGRSYILLLPFNAPFDEAHDVMLEFAKDILEEKRIRQEVFEKSKLEQELSNQRAEASEGEKDVSN
jgi:hypothetical protein